jgi:pimeloyl-ACP methyl ester carboxylesterase
MTIELRNGRVSLALHTLQQAEGLPLLLLHELGGSADDFRAQLPAWPGPVFALDFSGHGRSGRVYGGGYYPELWVADADVALAELTRAAPAATEAAATPGELVVLGRGLGAYAALLLAGGRPEQVRCAALCDGSGLLGPEAPAPTDDTWWPDLVTAPRAQALRPIASTDPVALEGQDGFLRPPDYAARFAERARRIVLVEDGGARPGWWRAVAEVAGVQRCDDARQWQSYQS